MPGVISTVDILNATNYANDERSVIFDVCRDGTGNVHMRINDGKDEIVLELTAQSAGNLAKLVYRAATGDD